MVFPYRTPASIEPDLPLSPCPSPYRGPGQCAGCSRWAAGAPWVCAEITAGLGVWLKAVCAAGVCFLGTASAAVLMVALRAGAPRGGHPQGGVATVTHVATAASAPGREALAPRREALAPRREALAPRKEGLAGPRAGGEVQVVRQVAPAREETAATRPALGDGVALLSLRALGPVTHAPEELWRRAEALVRAGVDVVLTETRIAGRSVDEIEREVQPSARILPAQGGAGVEIASLSPGSLPWSAGLSRGDVVTAVNGYVLAAPEAALEAYASVRERGVAVIEVLRGGRPLVLKVSFAR